MKEYTVFPQEGEIGKDGYYPDVYYHSTASAGYYNEKRMLRVKVASPLGRGTWSHPCVNIHAHISSIK